MFEVQSEQRFTAFFSWLVYKLAEGDRRLQSWNTTATEREQQTARSDQVTGERHLWTEERDPGTRRNHTG